MLGLALGKNEKLTITAYKDSKRSRSKKVGSLEVMFNPATVQRSGRNRYREQQELNSGGRLGYFSNAEPEKIELSILIDGTIPGVIMSKPSSILPQAPQRTKVAEEVEKFLTLAYHINGSIHQPNFLKILMGSALKEIPCRLIHYTLEYSGFDAQGNPRRAEIQATFKEDVEHSKKNALIGRQSPDLTHHRQVRSEDTLPIMSQKVYGSSEWYVQVARFNGLDHFRDLPLGKNLVFPPLTGKSEE